MTINDIKHAKLTKWVNEIAALTTPDAVVLADGSSEQYDKLVQECVDNGLCVRLNEEKKPHSVLFNSDPSDVARVEKRTFISSVKEEDAGPTNHRLYEGSYNVRHSFLNGSSRFSDFKDRC